MKEIDLTTDIRYRGPLSYRGFRILGWLGIALSQVVLMAGMASRHNLQMEETMQVPLLIIEFISRLALPFLLFANFAVILDNKNGYKGQLIQHGAFSGVFVVLFYLLTYRYIGSVLAALSSSGQTGGQMIEEFFHEYSTTGYMAFNFFVDLLQCTLFMFFLNYRPKRVFVGKKLIWFRLMTLIPVFYEIASIVLKLLSGLKQIRIPLFLFPFLTAKPPAIFMVFTVLALFLKRREYRFRRNGFTHEEYKRFLKTNRNSWHFSAFAAVFLVVAAILDVIITVVVILLQSRGQTDLQDAVFYVQTLGMGGAISLLPMAPLMLLFSYTRTYKNKRIDIIIPLAGILLCVLVYLEGFRIAVPMAIRSLLQ